MKKTVFFLLVSVIGLGVKAQVFEGKISYRNIYTSKMANVTSEQFTAMMGGTQDYYIKGGNYRSESPGTMFQWQLYRTSDNKLYTKMKGSDVLLWNDGAMNNDEVLKSEVNKAVVNILGYKCDELILTCKSGIQKYYYTSALAVDPSLFVDHKFGNWYEYVSRARSLSLRSVVETAQFILVMEATEVKAMALDDQLFTLPAGVKTMKSPY